MHERITDGNKNANEMKRKLNATKLDIWQAIAKSKTKKRNKMKQHGIKTTESKRFNAKYHPQPYQGVSGRDGERK